MVDQREGLRAQLESVPATAAASADQASAYLARLNAAEGALAAERRARADVIADRDVLQVRAMPA